MRELLATILAVMAFAALTAALNGFQGYWEPDPTPEKPLTAFLEPVRGIQEESEEPLEELDPVHLPVFVYNQGWVLLPPEIPERWAREFVTVALCESNVRLEAQHTTTIAGTVYRVVGAPQLLWDSAMASTAAELGYTFDEVRQDLAVQLRVAYRWWQKTGGSWSHWVCKP